MYNKFNIVKGCDEEWSWRKQRRELMVGANQCVKYPCPLTSEPET